MITAFITARSPKAGKKMSGSKSTAYQPKMSAASRCNSCVESEIHLEGGAEQPVVFVIFDDLGDVDSVQAAELVRAAMAEYEVKSRSQLSKDTTAIDTRAGSISSGEERLRYNLLVARDDVVTNLEHFWPAEGKSWPEGDAHWMRIYVKGCPQSKAFVPLSEAEYDIAKQSRDGAINVAEKYLSELGYTVEQPIEPHS